MSKTLKNFVALVLFALAVPAFAQSPAPGRPASAEATAPRPRDDAAVSGEVLGRVARLRGLTIMSPVANGLTSRDAIKAMVLKDLAESSSPQQMRDSTALLRFLGLVPGDFELERETVALLTEQIA